MYAENRNFALTAKSMGYSSSTLRSFLKRNKVFAAMIDEIDQMGCDAAQATLFKNAMDGKDKTSSSERIFLLKTLRREKFSDRLEVDHQIKLNVDITANPAASKLLGRLFSGVEKRFPTPREQAEIEMKKNEDGEYESDPTGPEPGTDEDGGVSPGVQGDGVHGDQVQRGGTGLDKA